MLRQWSRGSVGNALLCAGIAAVFVYVIGDLVSALLYEGYSMRDQAISELTAFGSPVRHVMVAVMLIHSVLLVAFGAQAAQLSAPTRDSQHE